MTIDSDTLINIKELIFDPLMREVMAINAGLAKDVEAIRSCSKDTKDSVNCLSAKLDTYIVNFERHTTEEKERDENYITKEEFEPVQKFFTWTKWLTYGAWTMTIGVLFNILASYAYDKFK